MTRKRLDGRAWATIRAYVLHRDNYRCQIRSDRCTHRATEVDHIEPVVNGGTDHTSNLRASCMVCNRSRWLHDNYCWTGVPFTK